MTSKFLLWYLATIFSSQKLEELIEKHQGKRQIFIIVSEKKEVNLYYSLPMYYITPLEVT